MNTPRVIFGYSLEKDVENIKIGLEAVMNGRKSDGELAAIIEKYGEKPSDENLREYLTTRWHDKEAMRDLMISQLQQYWDGIEGKFFTHLADRMQLASFFDIEQLPGYFSVRYGSGYSKTHHWFAVSAHKGTLQNTLIAMHEIMHIFFHKQWWEFCKNEGLSDKNIWDVKEAMTVLLNLWFGNLVVDVDLGYEEHTELRRSIKKWFLDSRDFKKTLKQACEYMKSHQEKSPTWVR